MSTPIQFNDTTHSVFMAKQKAELYTQLYQYAAEDFITIPDQNRHADELNLWGKSIENKLSVLGKQLQLHTHEITPHIHAIPYHSHEVAPHTHTNGNNGAPTGPQIGPLQTITSTLTETESTLNMTNQTKKAFNESMLGWNRGTVPIKPDNTTGAVSNLVQNHIITGKSTIGDLTSTGNRRELIIPILMTPSVPPLTTKLAAAGL